MAKYSLSLLIKLANISKSTFYCQKDKYFEIKEE